jgi:SAM-dependent methyltransferase
MLSKMRKYLTNLLYPLALRVVRKKESVDHHRKLAYIILEGVGIEIGAMHNPQKLSSNAIVEYVDIITKEEAISKYPELINFDIVNVKYKCDIDKAGLTEVESGSKDFAIICHIIEHTANPIFLIEELFRILKTGGYLVIACPDKNFTFDKERPLTTWEHLKNDYHNKINYVEDEHLLENIHFFSKDYTDINKEKEFYKNGKAHVHVWDSNSFDSFLNNTFKLLELHTKTIFKSTGYENEYEYFAIIKKK